MALNRKQKAKRKRILGNIYESHGKRRNHAVVSWNMLSDKVRFGSNSPRTARRLDKTLTPRGYLVHDDLTISTPFRNRRKRAPDDPDWGRPPYET